MSTPAQQAGSTLSTAERVRRYIDERPVVRTALAQGLINLSELTRQIVADTDLQGKHAILAACRRYAADLEPGAYGQRIREALSTARLDVRTQIESLTFDAGTTADVTGCLGPTERDSIVHLVHGQDRFTVVTEAPLARELREALPDHRLQAARRGLVEARVSLPEDAAGVPGFASFLSSSLAQRGVDPVHQVTGPRSTAFVFDQSDLTTTVSVLDPLIGT